ncbi:MAG: dehydrogenase E1 component subunit alpha/beta [Acidobacteriota bacterium]
MENQERLLHYAFMKFARDFDVRYTMLLKTGRLAKWYSQIGGEATTAAAGLRLEAGDVLCSLHRDLGAILPVYLDPARAFPGFGFGEPDGLRPEPEEMLYRLACQLLGRADGFSNGIERSFHYANLDPDRGIQHIGMISHLGAMIPVAAGAAFALKQSGTDRVAVNFIGDGGTSTGDFHEGVNMAAVWKLPLVLVIENNRYAFATPTRDQFACERLSDRALGYGIAGETVDGNDPEVMSEALGRAIDRARRGEGPTLIEAMLGRMRGHSEGDDSLKVVPKDELEVYMANDPVPTYARRLMEEGVLEHEVQDRLEERISELVEGALERALDCPGPDDAVAHRPAYAPVDSALDAPEAPDAELDVTPAEIDPEVKPQTYIEGIHQALGQELERDDKVLVFGQDIAVFEGAFRITKGFHARWPDRVRDTPIAESGTLGIAAGAALLGYRPVVEMQFGDFITCGFNQTVNLIAKLFYRWQLPCPLVIRLPAGGGVGAGPFHSQNPEAWFAHVAGLKVVCPATAEDAKTLLVAAIRDPNPVIFCEHKFLYRRIKAHLPDAHHVPALGPAAVRREGTDLTFITYGAQVFTCLEAAEKLVEEGVDAEVIDLRTLVPLDEEAIFASVRKTGRAVVVHEAQLTGGFGGEIAARIADEAFAYLDAPVRRVAYADRAVPFAKNLEKALLPSLEKVLSAARDVLAY